MKKIALIFCLILVFFISQIKYYHDKMTPIYTVATEIPQGRSIVYFYINGCTACSEYKKITTDFINEYSIPIYAINVEDYDKEELDKLDINEVPTSIFINEDGSVIDREVGILEKEEILELYEKTE